VVVTAASQFLAPGDTVRFTAQVMDADGKVLPTEAVTWSSSSPRVATVDALGLVTADSVGATTITATAGGKHGNADLTVQVSVLCDCTTIVDSTAVSLISRNDTTGVYVFRVRRGPATGFDVGDIIVGAEGEGYLRRIVQRSEAGDLLTLETTQAYVEEAVRDGGFSTTAYADSSSGVPQPGAGAWVGPWTTTYMAAGVRLNNAGGCCSLNGLQFALKLGGTAAGTLDFTIKQGTIGFSPRVAMATTVRAFQLTQYEHILRGDLGLDIDLYELKVGVTGNKTFAPEKLAKESQTFIIQQRPYATFIGPMPVLVIFTKKLSLEITPTVSATAVFTGEFHSGLRLETGVRWTNTGGWKPVASATPYFNATAPLFQGVEGSASVKIAVVPEFNALIYGVVGPFVNLEPFAEAAAASTLSFASGQAVGLDWDTKVSLGLNLNMGAKLSVFGRKDLLQVGFAIPLVKPIRLVRDFSDGPLMLRSITTGVDTPATYGVRLRPAFVDTLPFFGVRDLSTSTRDVVIAPNGSTTLDRVKSGRGFPHRLTLTNVAGNCFVLDSLRPDTVAINSSAFIFTGAAPTDTVFKVDCIPLGDLQVRTMTTGPNRPPRYFVTLLRKDTVGTGRADQAETVSIPGGVAPADTVLENFIPVNTRRGGTGRLDATLDPGRRNCAVARPATSPLVMQSGDTATTQFLVTCVPLGLLRLYTSTADPDPDPSPSAASAISYLPSLTPQAPQDTVAAPPGPVTAGDSTLVSDLVPLYNASGAPGRYTVNLGNAPNRCTETAGFARTVTVFPGDTAIADFAVRCVERLQVITTTIGPGTDPDGYAVILTHSDSTADTARAALNDTVGVTGLVPGRYDIRLGDVEPSCVGPAAVLQKAVDGRDSTLVRFQVSCPAPPQPSGLVATLVDSNRVDLAWTPIPPATPVAWYRIYRDNVLHDSSTTAVFSDPGLPPNTVFDYRVSAVSPLGLEGARSAQLRVRTRDATAPSAPSALLAAGVSGSQVDLSWQPAADSETGIAAYVIYRDGAEVGRTTTNAVADRGLAPFTAYSYEVSAVNGDGLEGPRTGPATATTHDVTPPTAPTALTPAVVSPSQVDLTWSPATDPETGVQGYNIYRNGLLAGNATTTAFSDQGLIPNTTYTYTVAAVNGQGLLGPSSPPATATTFPDQTPPTAPGGLTANAVTSSRINLTWSAATDPESGVPGYNVYRDGVLVASPTTTSFSDLGLTPNTSYSYTVAAVNGAGLEGPPSQPASAVTPPDDTEPTAPGGLVATAVSSSQIDLAWSAAGDPESGIQGYNVYRSGVLVGTAITTAFSEQGLAPGTSYTYTVTAVNGAGLEGPPSPPATATTIPDQTPPTAPGGLSATAVSSSQINLAWTAAGDPESGIALYRVYRDGVLTDSTTATGFADASLLPGISYTYEVAAVNGAGLEGPRSQPATATTPGAATGDLNVTTQSNGPSAPTGYQVAITGSGVSLVAPAPATGSTGFPDLPAQIYSVRLESVPSSCNVEGGNLRTVTVTAGTTVTAAFTIVCQ